MPGPSAPSAGHLLDVSVLIEHFATATAAHCAGRREAGFMAEPLADDNPPQRVAAKTTALRHPRGCRVACQGPTGRFRQPGVAPAPYLGASTITTWRPSKRASCSTLAKLDVSSLTRLSSL